MNFGPVVTTVVSALLIALIFGYLHLWSRHRAGEQTLYGQSGEPGLVEEFKALRAEVKERDHKLRNVFQEHYGRLEERVRELERLIPRRDR